MEKRSLIAPWKEIASDFCSPSEIILLNGKEIMKLGLKNEDALHIACAIEKQCDYFITTDSKLTHKSIEGITVINPIDFIRQMDDLL